MSFELTAEDSYGWDKENKEKTSFFCFKNKNDNHQIKHEDCCGQFYAFFKNVGYLKQNVQESLTQLTSLVHCKEPVLKIRTNIPRKGIGGQSPNFLIHVYVSDFYIFTIYPILGIYKPLTDT
jgi:hypothetical protein